MEVNQAAENLQTIRTLMERSALYRRALAPIMTLCGVLGIAAGVLGWQLGLQSDRSFFFFWSSAAGLALLGSFLLVRRQALKDSEPFWSPPTRRIAQALLPPFFIALFVTAYMVFLLSDGKEGLHQMLIVIWITLYGCGLHAAGFFVSRGFQILAWAFCFAGLALVVVLTHWNDQRPSPSLLMGGVFGSLHLAAGIYLYFTEKRGNES